MTLPVPNPFLKPGTPGRIGGNYTSPGFQRHRAIAVEARGKPGAWVDLDTARSNNSAFARVTNLRKKPGILFRSDRLGSFEFRAEQRDDGYAVQVRYVRNSQGSPQVPGSPSPAVQGVAAADGEVPALSPAVMGAGTEQDQET